MVVTTAMRGGCRRKGNGMVVKSWMVVSETGESRVEDIDKHSIMQRTGLPTRDLRALDPKLSNPSSILGREKAIVVNLEHIQAIITSNEVLMINSTNPFFLRFLQDLQARLPRSNNIQMPSDNVDGDYEAKPLFDDSPNNASEGIFEAGSPNAAIAGIVSAPKQLPFEFKALEACIESTCTCLESEVCDINVLYV
jgi:magnesium transporter